MRYLSLAVVVFVLLCLSYCMGKRHADAVVEHDTISVRVDSAHSETVYVTKTLHVPSIRYVTKVDTVPVPCDTVLLKENVVYEDSDYTAWVSGISPSLDSISINKEIREYRDTFMIYTDRIFTVGRKQKKWGIGLGVGYGATKDGLTPFIGVTFHYNLFN